MRLMQTRWPARCAWILSTAAACLCLCFGSARAYADPAAAPAQPGNPAAAPANPAAAETEIPQSVFINPTTPQEGRDPFFPNSRRRIKTHVIVPTNAPVTVVELELKGISGSADRPLAIINNRTFEPGEEGTVVSKQGRIRVICKEILPDSVRVIFNGQERTLTLRSLSPMDKSRP